MNDGDRAEALAADFLSRQGLRVLARNVRYRDGELDLVCEQDGQLVFVEVRLRRNTRFGGAAASVGRAKQARLTRAAQRYLAQGSSALRRKPCRFDVLALNALDAESVEWIRDAFTP